MEIIKFQEEHIEAATELFNRNYIKTLKHHPYLPHKYKDKHQIIDKIKWIHENHYGVVALENGKLVGFLLGIIIEEFKCSRTGVYCPEWAHASIEGQEDFIYNIMYKSISSSWKQDQCVSHCITFLANQKTALDVFNWNGFAPFVVDAARYLEPLDLEVNNNVSIIQASKDDIKDLVAIQKEHDAYMRGATTYLNHDHGNEVARLSEDFNDDFRTVWLVKYKGQAVGLMNTKLHSDDACTIVQDKNTVSILTTHVLDAYKGLGIGKAMVQHIVNWSKHNGFERCTVDFESANYEARRFWSKHFNIVCVSVMRYIDDRV